MPHDGKDISLRRWLVAERISTILCVVSISLCGMFEGYLLTDPSFRTASLINQHEITLKGRDLHIPDVEYLLYRIEPAAFLLPIILFGLTRIKRIGAENANRAVP